MTPTDTPPEATRPEVCILMGMYNGAAHLQDQLDSYIAQSHRNWSLIISDDGSTDESPRIARAFARAHPDRAIEIRPGPRRGFARNFLSLLQAAPGDVPFVALSDQDDVWFPARLERAVKALHVMDPATPALYCGATLVCDETLAPLGVSATFRRDPDFRNALVQSIGGGNTMVLNHAATALAEAAAAEASDPVSHDWWLYQIVTGCGGVVLRDPDPVLYYRQHRDNLIGANVTRAGRLLRILAVLGGRFTKWNRIGLAALHASRHRFTPEAQRVMTQFERARHGAPWTRLLALRRSGVHRQNPLGTVALYIACLLRRI